MRLAYNEVRAECDEVVRVWMGTDSLLVQRTTERDAERAGNKVLQARIADLGAQIASLTAKLSKHDPKTGKFTKKVAS